MEHLQQALALLVVALFSGGGLLGSQATDAPGTAAALGDPAEMAASSTSMEGCDCPTHEIRKKAEAALTAPHELRFEENRGQAPDEVLFAARTPDAEIWLGSDRIEAHGEDGSIALVFPGADPARVSPHQPLGTRTHYYIGSDPEQWVEDVPNHRQLIYRDLWPGVDMVVYGTEDGRLEFDHVVAPGADPDVVRFRAEGARPALEAGALLLGGFRLEPPVVYQEEAAGRQPVPGTFVVEDDLIGYRLGAYDASRALVIDPVLHYSSRMASPDRDEVHGIDWAPHPDPAKRTVYVTGTTRWSFFPNFTSNSTFGTSFGNPRVYVAAFAYDIDTKSMSAEWVVHLGGSDDDESYALATDPTGGVVVAGLTVSPDLPTLNSMQVQAPPYDGSVHQGGTDGFVARLDTTGAMTFSTYLGSRDNDWLTAVAVDANGRIAVAGHVEPDTTVDQITLYPLVNPYQAQPSGYGTTVVSFLDPSTSGFLFSTYFGGGYASYAKAIDVDATGVYVAGQHLYGGTGFPTTLGAFQQGVPESIEPIGFLSKFPPSGGLDLVYSTVIGGSGADGIRALAVDGQGQAWVAGATASADFPACGNPASYGGSPCTGNVLQSTAQGDQDAFVTQFDATGSGVLFSSYLGGTDDDEGSALALDPVTDEVVVAVQTLSTNLPMHPTDRIFTAPVGFDEGYLHRFHPPTVLAGPAGSMGFTTYLGSSSIDHLRTIAVDDHGNLYSALQIWSKGSNYPITPQAVQPGPGGGAYDGTLSVIGRAAPDAVVRATSGAVQESSDLPGPGGPVLLVEPGWPVRFDSTLSTGGDLPLDPGRFEWTLHEGATLLSTEVGALPSWDGIALGVGEARYVCLRVWNEGPWPGPPSPTRDLRGHGDFHDQACIEVVWRNRPPVADFAVPDKVSQDVPVAFTDRSTDPDGSVVAWWWDFGDGSAPVEVPDPVHTFTAAGSYEVVLRVTDDRGLVDRTTRNITVLGGPVAAFSYPAGGLLMREPVPFQDLSSPGWDPIGTWRWEFGDGSTVEHQGEVPAGFAHVFEEAGRHDVTLTVSDGALSDVITHPVVIVAPEPLPVADVYEALPGQDLEVQEGVLANDGHPAGWPLSVASFTRPVHGSVQVQGDGSFRYTPPKEFVGTDTFTYHVTDGHTTVGPVPVEVVVASGVPPQTDFDVVMSGDTASFQDRSVRGDLPIVAWRWTFSDGPESSVRDPHRVFPPGAHSVTLEVTDAAGASSRMTKTFHIVAPPVGAGAASQVMAPGPGVPEAQEDAASAAALDRPPMAVASGPTQAMAGEQVLLDATGSHDPDGDPLSFRWRQIEGPPVMLDGEDRAEAIFPAPGRPGMLVFGLEVSDGHTLATAEATVEVVVPDPLGFHVEVLDDGTHWFNATTDASWALGDGTTATGASVAHRFPGPREYVVRMEVDGVESVQRIRVDAGEAPGAVDAEPAVDAGPGPAQAASVPEARVPTAVTATAAGMALLVLLVWAYRTWALVWIRVFTRVGRPDILGHPLRSQIHDAVQDRPGLLLTDLLPMLGKSRRTVAHHVGMLEGAGMLVVKRAGGYVSLHPKGDLEEHLPKDTVLRSKVAQRLLRAATTMPGLTVGDLTRQLAVDQSTVSYHVGRLASAGLVRKVREGRTTRLFPS